MEIESVLQDKYRGCMIGLALGDALGVPFEFWARPSVEKYLDEHELTPVNFGFGGRTFPAGFYSDDTAMAICLAESLIEKGFDLDDQHERYLKWYLTGYAAPFNDSCYGIGQQTLRSLMWKQDFNNLDGSNANAGGNGSLMRCAPVGLCYAANYVEIKEKSLLSGYITHNYFISGWSCVILNSAISLILEGLDKFQIIPALKEKYCGDIPKELADILDIDFDNLDLSEIRPTGYSADSLKIALWAWLTTSDYLSSIKKVILLGGDTDTYGAITGALAGCYYGYDSMPESHKLKIIKHDYILNLADQIFNKRYERAY